MDWISKPTGPGWYVVEHPDADMQGDLMLVRVSSLEQRWINDFARFLGPLPPPPAA